VTLTRFRLGFRLTLAAVFMVSWGGGAYAKPAKVEAFPFVKNLITEGESEDSLGAFALDAEIMAVTHEDFANLRIVDDSDTEIPYLVRARGRADGSGISSHEVSYDVHNDDSKTRIEFTSDRQPVTGIRILTSGASFSRPVVIEGKSGVGHAGFRTVFHGTVSHVATGGAGRDDRVLRLPHTTRCSEWRVTIENHDNPALPITGVELIERIHEAVFVNMQPSRYRVLYGGDETQRPRYDMPAIMSRSGNAEMATFRLGGEQENDDYGRSWWPLRIGGQTVLTLAILGMVAVLGWGIATAAKSTELS